MIKKIIALSICAITINQADACTAISSTANDGSVVVGRTMEWAYDMNWKFINYPIGTKYKLTAPANLNLKSIDMVSKYQVSGIGTGLVNNALLDGQNNAGLALSANFFPQYAQYMTVNKDDQKYASILELTQFILSNFSSTNDVITALSDYKVWEDQAKGSPQRPMVHLMISDKSGNSAVVEWIDGKMVVYKNASIMTNAPDYNWHTTNIKNYIGLSNKTINSIPLNKSSSITAFGQGGGGFGLPGDYTSTSRYVKMAFLKYYSTPPKTLNENVQYVDHLLNNVDIPQGAITDKDSDTGVTYYDETQWVAIKSLKNNVLYFANYDNRTNFVEIDLNSIKNKKIIMDLSTIKPKHSTYNFN